MNNYTDEIRELAIGLGTATLYEASGIINCALDPLIRPVWQGAAVAGTAYPVACSPGDNLAIQIALERAPSGSVLTVTTNNFVAGYWGEVLTVAAESSSIKGLVIDGGVRDVAALRKRQFPAFSRGISVRGTTKASYRSVGQPIQITGTPAKQGDLIVADDDGVIILPQALALEIIVKGQVREQQEATMMKRLTDGESTLDLMGLAKWRKN
ncbi:MAG: 4-carboxy-4-hydroxy-2-oxoadipate aldolase/oxaloacetate decarboxylase [Enterobacterales bacterium]|nr:4-carboxy-4-hydroxy-2-oxoadipate aldolase/oxaloacetate decarboxylase [Enterobacterales bacterium]